MMKATFGAKSVSVFVSTALISGVALASPQPEPEPEPNPEPNFEEIDAFFGLLHGVRWSGELTRYNEDNEVLGSSIDSYSACYNDESPDSRSFLMLGSSTDAETYEELEVRTDLEFMSPSSIVLQDRIDGELVDDVQEDEVSFSLFGSTFSMAYESEGGCSFVTQQMHFDMESSTWSITGTCVVDGETQYFHGKMQDIYDVDCSEIEAQ